MTTNKQKTTAKVQTKPVLLFQILLKYLTIQNAFKISLNKGHFNVAEIGFMKNPCANTQCYHEVSCLTVLKYILNRDSSISVQHVNFPWGFIARFFIFYP